MKADSSHIDGNSSHLNEALANIARSVAHKKKLSKLENRDIILRLCKGRYLSVELLASLLKRNSNGLRNRHLTPMVAEGLLQLRYPDTPNRPDQSYTAC